MSGNNTEKPISTVNTDKQNNARFKWLARAIPAFHCALIGIAFTLASFRFFITGEFTLTYAITIMDSYTY